MQGYRLRRDEWWAQRVELSGLKVTAWYVGEEVTMEELGGAHTHLAKGARRTTSPPASRTPSTTSETC
jgi:acetyl-CoA carboxylase carboxyltransferase component